MTLNENVLKGKWLEMKGDLRAAWGKLTDDELEKTKGDLQSIRGLVQQKYGETKEANGKKIDAIFQKFEEKKDAAIKSTKETLKKK